MLSLEVDGWHVWRNTQGRVLATDPHHMLLDFADTDEAVNWFYVNDHKEVARALNEQAKKYKLAR